MLKSKAAAAREIAKTKTKLATTTQDAIRLAKSNDAMDAEEGKEEATQGVEMIG